MGFFSAARSLFQPQPQPQAEPKTEPAAWSDTDLLGAGSLQFPRYNPDELIGRKGFKIYRKMMIDEQVKAVIKFKRDAITARDWYFELDTDELGEEEKARRVKVSEEVLRQMEGTLLDALNGIMSAMYQGFSMTEKTHKQIEVEGVTWWGLKHLRLKPFDTFLFHTDHFGNLERLIQRVHGEDIDLDIRDFIHLVHSQDVDEWYGQSELREAYRAWFSKDVLLKMQNIYYERMASGFIWIETPEGKVVRPGTEDHNQLMSLLRNIQTKTGILLPHGFKLQIQFPTGGSPGWDTVIAQQDRSIAKALLVPALIGITEQGSTGSFAQAQTQLEAFLWSLDADAQRLTETLNEQLFKPLGELNFPDEHIPLFRFRPLSKTQLYELIKVWAQLISDGAVKASDSDEAHIRNLLEFPERDDESAANEPGTNDEPPGEQPPVTPPEDDQEPETPALDETIVGRGRVSVAAFTRALRRVDFAVIDRKSEQIADEYTTELAKAVDDVVVEALDRIERQELGTETGDLDAVKKLRLDGNLLRSVRAAVTRSLKAGWRLGEQEANRELDKARGEDMMRFLALQDRLRHIQEDFFDIRGFQMAGSLADDILNDIKNTLLSAARSSKTTKETRGKIVEVLAAHGAISPGLVESEIGQALPNVKNPRARLNNIVRTGTFEAINEARHATFSDPQLEGFVEALQYSAVLDSRTTAICSHLDGRTYPRDDPMWQSYRPPNHFQCRSLLVPVTRRDTWNTSPAPSISPQREFS